MKKLLLLLSSAAVCAVECYVPPSMALNGFSIETSTATLVSLEIKEDSTAVLESDATLVAEKTCMSASDVISTHSGKNGCLVFAVRRPGWVLCREEGKALSELMAREDKPLDGFGMFGLVKETDVDDAGLVEFYSDYFKYPMYRDEETAFYKALGSRKLGLKSWNPVKIFRGLREVGRRLKAKGISGNFKGEGLVQGGVVIFDSAGEARFAYREETGEEMPVEDIVAAVRALKSET